jgi:hypothetical protein
MLGKNQRNIERKIDYEFHKHLWMNVSSLSAFFDKTGENGNNL